LPKGESILQTHNPTFIRSLMTLSAVSLFGQETESA
jgi:hypothetical protein